VSRRDSAIVAWHEVPGNSAIPKSRPVGYGLIRCRCGRQEIPPGLAAPVTPYPMGRAGRHFVYSNRRTSWPFRTSAPVRETPRVKPGLSSHGPMGRRPTLPTSKLSGMSKLHTPCRCYKGKARSLTYPPGSLTNAFQIASLPNSRHTC
jgi:hypothetical protein